MGPVCSFVWHCGPEVGEPERGHVTYAPRLFELGLRDFRVSSHIIMRRTPLRFDISIAGDEQEQSRIQLEKNLLHTDLSLHLSSTHDDYSVENPRHQSSVSVPFSAFDSIDRSRDALDLDEGLSQPHAWSYRTGEDDEGIHPFVGGETLSTAAHHASALTLSAGLGGRGERRDISLSGAEYDPERPLQDLIAGIGTKFTSFNAEKSSSRHAVGPLVSSSIYNVYYISCLPYPVKFGAFQSSNS